MFSSESLYPGSIQKLYERQLDSRGNYPIFARSLTAHADSKVIMKAGARLSGHAAINFPKQLSGLCSTGSPESAQSAAFPMLS